MKRLPKLFFVILFVGALFFFLAATLLVPTRTVSTFERRTLAAIPSVTGTGLWDGTYFTAWETAYSDHVACRDTLLKTYTGLSLALNRPAVNGIIPSQGKLLAFYNYGHWDLSYLKEEAAAASQSYAALNQAVAAYGGTFLYVGLPQQTEYFAESYPAYMENRLWHTTAVQETFSAAMTEAGVPFLNMLEVYQAAGKPEAYYYATDHHYTYAGAYVAYQAILEALNARGLDLPVMEKDDLVWQTLKNPFLGSSNRKLYGLYNTTDAVEIAYPKENIPFTRTDNGETVAAQVFSLPEDEESQVDYSVYMGGDQGETILQTNRPALKKLLVVGDSFTNPLETLLWMSFDETRSLDYRYYKGEGILTYIAAYQPDVVLLVRDGSLYLSLEENGAVS